MKPSTATLSLLNLLLDFATWKNKRHRIIRDERKPDEPLILLNEDELVEDFANVLKFAVLKDFSKQIMIGVGDKK